MAAQSNDPVLSLTDVFKTYKVGEMDAPAVKTTASESPVVRFREVGKVYDDEGLRVTAIRSVTFDITKKRFAMIVGPSGSGKTTLLNLIGCIDTPTSGRLEVCGQDIGRLGDRALTAFRSR